MVNLDPYNSAKLSCHVIKMFCFSLQIEDNNTQDIQEDEKIQKETDKTVAEEATLETPEDIVKVQQLKIQPDVTPQPLHRPPQQQTQTQQQAYNVEYSSSPSSTTSSLNRGKQTEHTTQNLFCLTICHCHCFY